MIQTEGDIMRTTQLEAWLRARVAPAFDAIKADPSRAVSIERIRARLAAQHAVAKNKLNRPG